MSIDRDKLNETLAVYEKAHQEHSELSRQHAAMSNQCAEKAVRAAGAIEAIKNLIAMEEAKPDQPESTPAA